MSPLKIEHLQMRGPQKAVLFFLKKSPAAMEQPFAPRAAAPVLGTKGLSNVKSVWVQRPEGKFFLVFGSITFDWFSDEQQKSKKGSVKLNSLTEVSRKDAELTVATAMKSHVFTFSSNEDAMAWEAELKKHM